MKLPILKWNVLYDMSNFLFIKHSFFYILVTPIVATIINAYFSEYSMPFNLLISYIGSLFFLLGRVLTILKLPSFLNNIPTYKTYIDLKLTRNDLESYVDNPKKTLTEKMYYDEIYKEKNQDNEKLRKIISIIYYIGWGCFVILFLQGAINVSNSI